MKAHFIYFLFFLGFTFKPVNTMATHIVGGELSYECNGNNDYTITGTLYRDGFDNYLYIDSFLVYFTDLATNELAFQTYIVRRQQTVVPPNDLGICLIDAPEVMTEKHIYNRRVTLPNNGRGYKASLQLCCRNRPVLNIVSPSSVGSTYFIDITAAALNSCNSSPKPKQDPPILICSNIPLEFDASANDRNGDRVEYRICEALSTPNLRPGCDFYYNCNQELELPPYKPVQYTNGFSATLPLGESDDPIAINNSSGLLTGRTERMGLYGVSICMDEYRGGTLMSTSNRDFQLTVADCVAQQLIVPTAFSPNGDDLNDTYRVQAVGFELFEISIFNRWGDLVYQSNDINESWDGSYKGKALSADIFAYQLKLQCSFGGQDYSQSGTITLIR